MEVRVLGNPDQYLAPLSDGSGYLVSDHDTRVLLDAGQGVRTALAEAGGAGGLDAVVLSHFHYDHVLDFVTIAPHLPDGCVVVAPPGGRGALAALARSFGFTSGFDLPGKLVEGRVGEEVKVGRLRLDFAPTQHSVPSFATRVRAANTSFVYASDTAPCQGLANLASNAHVLLAHTLLPTVEDGADHAARHATAASIARFATQARVQRLVLSHRYFESKDDDMLAAAASAADGGALDVTLAARDAPIDIA